MTYFCKCCIFNEVSHPGMPRISIMASPSYLDDHCSNCSNIFDHFLNIFLIIFHPIKRGSDRGKWVDILNDTLIWRTYHPNLHPGSSYHNFYSNNPNIYGAIYNTHLDIEDLMTPIHNVGKLVSNFPYIFNIPIVIIET